MQGPVHVLLDVLIHLHYIYYISVAKRKKEGFNLFSYVFLDILLSIIHNNPFGILLAHFEVALRGK